MKANVIIAIKGALSNFQGFGEFIAASPAFMENRDAVARVDALDKVFAQFYDQYPFSYQGFEQVFCFPFPMADGRYVMVIRARKNFTQFPEQNRFYDRREYFFYPVSESYSSADLIGCLPAMQQYVEKQMGSVGAVDVHAVERSLPAGLFAWLLRLLMKGDTVLLRSGSEGSVLAFVRVLPRLYRRYIAYALYVQPESPWVNSLMNIVTTPDEKGVVLPEGELREGNVLFTAYCEGVLGGKLAYTDRELTIKGAEEPTKNDLPDLLLYHWLHYSVDSFSGGAVSGAAAASGTVPAATGAGSVVAGSANGDPASAASAGSATAGAASAGSATAGSDTAGIFEHTRRYVGEFIARDYLADEYIRRRIQAIYIYWIQAGLVSTELFREFWSAYIANGGEVVGFIRQEIVRDHIRLAIRGLADSIRDFAEADTLGKELTVLSPVFEKGRTVAIELKEQLVRKNKPSAGDNTEVLHFLVDGLEKRGEDNVRQLEKVLANPELTKGIDITLRARVLVAMKDELSLDILERMIRECRLDQLLAELKKTGKESFWRSKNVEKLVQRLVDPRRITSVVLLESQLRDLKQLTEARVIEFNLYSDYLAVAVQLMGKEPEAVDLLIRSNELFGKKDIRGLLDRALDGGKVAVRLIGLGKWVELIRAYESLQDSVFVDKLLKTYKKLPLSKSNAGEGYMEVFAFVSDVAREEDNKVIETFDRYLAKLMEALSDKDWAAAAVGVLNYSKEANVFLQPGGHLYRELQRNSEEVHADKDLKKVNTIGREVVRQERVESMPVAEVADEIVMRSMSARANGRGGLFKMRNIIRVADRRLLMTCILLSIAVIVLLVLLLTGRGRSGADAGSGGLDTTRSVPTVVAPVHDTVLVKADSVRTFVRLRGEGGKLDSLRVVAPADSGIYERLRRRR